MKKIALRLTAAVFTLCMLSAVTSCASRPVLDTAADERAYPQQLYVPESFDWQQVCPGIDRFDFNNTSFPVRYHAVRIDLATDGLMLTAVPGTGTDGKKTGNLSTSVFAKKYGCTVAMNTTPFTAGKKIVGIHLFQRERFAPPADRYCALVFRRDPDTGLTFRASVADTQSEENLKGAEYAFGGFFSILRNGEKKLFPVSRHDSRSCAGVSKDGRMLYLLVVEGEVPGKSTGLSYPQCADILSAMGCTDAMEFDGGSSSDLCINGTSVLSYPIIMSQAASIGFTVRKPDGASDLSENGR